MRADLTMRKERDRLLTIDSNASAARNPRFCILCFVSMWGTLAAGAYIIRADMMSQFSAFPTGAANEDLNKRESVQKPPLFPPKSTTTSLGSRNLGGPPGYFLFSL